MSAPVQQDLFTNPVHVDSRPLKRDVTFAAKAPADPLSSCADHPARDGHDAVTPIAMIVAPLIAAVQTELTAKRPKTAKEKKAQAVVSLSPELAALRALCLLSVKQVATQYAVSPPTVWRWLKEQPDFPQPVKFGGSTRWYAGDIIAHLSALRGDR